MCRFFKKNLHIGVYIWSNKGTCDDAHCLYLKKKKDSNIKSGKLFIYCFHKSVPSVHFYIHVELN